MTAPAVPTPKNSRARQRLVTQLREQGIKDEAVLAAIASVPREAFLADALKSRAYENTALPIGAGQTISQPLIVAKMTEIIHAKARSNSPLSSVLEVGTGSGYQAAVLAELLPRVYSIERIESLFKETHRLLWKLGYRNIRLRRADGNLGWPEAAPFDAIIVTAAPDTVPQALLQQLSPEGGLMVIPVGNQGQAQQLKSIVRRGDTYDEKLLASVSFVPMLTGEKA